MAAKMLIGGEWVAAGTEATAPVVNPFDGSTIAEVPVGSRDDARRAIDAARDAFDKGPWPKLPPRARGEVLLKVAKLLGERLPAIAELESHNQGKTIKQAADADLPFAIDNLVFYAGACRTLDARSPGEYTGDGTTIFRREPVGVVASITPWNYPLMMAVWKIAPALSVGNTVVLKPATWTPLTTLELGRAFQDAGLPPGALNVVTGPGGEVGDELARHPSVDLVSLTGDTATGKKIMEAASGTVKRVQLELGGKAPFVVFADADLNAAVEGAVVGGFVNGGQDCTAATRLIVHESLREAFVTKLVERLRTFRIGDPLARTTDLGPLVHRTHQQRVLGFVETGKSEGAKLRLGGAPPAGPHATGAFVAPTVFDEVHADMEIAQREVFGPVVDVLTFSTFDEAIWTANSVVYGLAGSVWTNDVRTAVRAANALRFGDVWVNDHLPLGSETPHGGMKQSGFGKDLGVDSLADYTVTKNIYIDLTGQARKGWHYTVYGDPS
ncbi:MAG TPA: aldehyde dehydrogenase family protein [Thermoplasmata archaeon]|jgi:betaine-aldehyde dehydrogenase|nr:aldehyde dehydrogenase family protein [Thermoplasmata archaeon]